MARTARAGAAVAPRPLRRAHPRLTPPRAVPHAVRARGESVLDALQQGQAWIALVALLLVGIVFFNVDLLRLNRSIAVTSEKAGGVARENARLRRELARLGSSERVQRAALERGLMLPAPGDVRFRRAGERDGGRAVDNIRAPGQDDTSPGAAQGAGPGSTAPGLSTPQAAAPQRAAPQGTAPQVAAPGAPAPQAAIPQVPTPQVATPPTATPQATAPGPATTPGAG